MANHTETATRVLKLAATCIIGISHLKAQLAVGHIENALLLLHDFVEAFYRMEQTVGDCAGPLARVAIAEHSSLVRQALDEAIGCLEQAQWARALGLIQLKLLPSFLAWTEELERSMDTSPP